MPRVIACVLVLALAGASSALGAEPAALARARTLYNAADYDGAIEAASEARRQPVAADAAALVLARAFLERYRQRADPSDLASAREALRAVDQRELGRRDRVDLLVGLGQSLFLGESYGAAAELFDAALIQGAVLPIRARMLLLDWWASALDREAQSRPADRRAAVFDRIVSRMEDELRMDPGSAPALYWLAVAARGSGDTERSWDAAIAGWVRAGLEPDTAASVRADLDRFVTQALIPERARLRGGNGGAVDTMRGEWELIKTQWP
jgi:hypothetical protein